MLRIAAIAMTLSFALPAAAAAGRIVVNHDEWTLSDSGYAAAGAANADQFAKNLAAFLAAGPSGNILISSTNFGLTGSSLLASLAGYSVTYDSATPLTSGFLSGFDAVFLAGDYPTLSETAALAAYVNAGGGIYIAAGTGVGGAAVEAAAWNALLNGFGLSLGPVYNGVCCVIPASYAHPIFAGVTQLFYNNGNTVSDLLPADPAQQVFGSGLIGIYERSTTATPAPAAIALFGLGALALGIARRTRA